MIASYPIGFDQYEYALAFDKDRAARLLIVPALFEEASRMRRLTVEVMRRLDLAGIDCFLPDLPGCGESLAALETQTLSGWRIAIESAARHFCATHVFMVRGGGLLVPHWLPGWRYASVKGSSLLRQMLRARIIASRESGVSETQEELLATGAGLELAGYRLGAEFIAEFQLSEPQPSDKLSEIPQELIGGGGLWLRAEPDEDRHQADSLAAIIAVGIKS